MLDKLILTEARVVFSDCRSASLLQKYQIIQRFLTIILLLDLIIIFQSSAAIQIWFFPFQWLIILLVSYILRCFLTLILRIIYRIIFNIQICGLVILQGFLMSVSWWIWDLFLNTRWWFNRGQDYLFVLDIKFIRDKFLFLNAQILLVQVIRIFIFVNNELVFIFQVSIGFEIDLFLQLLSLRLFWSLPCL